MVIATPAVARTAGSSGAGSTAGAAASASKSKARADNIVTYTIDHAQRPSGDLTAVTILHGQTLHIVIMNTNTDCYYYNANEEKVPSLEALEADSPTHVATLDVVHDEDTVAYIIDVTPKDTDTSRCPEGTRSWRIPVRSLWNLAGAGGFAGHKLTDPVFYLLPGERTKTDGSKEQGFTIHENASARDNHKIVGAAFAHLYQAGLGWRGVNIAPLSFGISVDSSRADYMVGSSLRFGTRAYLTFGRLFGTVQRLPAELSTQEPNNFTTNANALSTLPTRRAQTWFFALSFSFLESGVSNLFKNRLGIPQVNNSGGAQTQANTGQASGNVGTLKPSPDSGKPKDKITLDAPSGIDFGGKSDDSSVLIHATNGKEVKLQSKDLTGDQKWTGKQIIFAVPDAFPEGDADVSVFLDKAKIATGKLKVTK
jgi:hypothetical protein